MPGNEEPADSDQATTKISEDELRDLLEDQKRNHPNAEGAEEDPPSSNPGES